MKKRIILGFDSSNYTTSLAALDEDGGLILNLKKLLPVKEGERGLRQSDAVFAHIKNFPEHISELCEALPDREILAVGVSTRPRMQEGSYMPCFLVGENMAISASSASSAPLYRFSHQCGHLAAALYSSGAIECFKKPFAAFHISGGTTEFLKVIPEEGGFTAQIIGGTRDLNAGQIIDRIGVKMGLQFPAGAEMEKLALLNTQKIPKRKITRDGLYLNLSGLENIADKLYSETLNKSLVAAFVLDYVGRALIELCDEYQSRFGETHFVFAGGVMSNSIIKNMISAKISASFAEPALSSDNAVGIAYLAYLENLKHSYQE